MLNRLTMMPILHYTMPSRNNTPCQLPKMAKGGRKSPEMLPLPWEEVARTDLPLHSSPLQLLAPLGLARESNQIESPQAAKPNLQRPLGGHNRIRLMPHDPNPGRLSLTEVRVLFDYLFRFLSLFIYSFHLIMPFAYYRQIRHTLWCHLVRGSDAFESGQQNILFSPVQANSSTWLRQKSCAGEISSRSTERKTQNRGGIKFSTEFRRDKQMHWQIQGTEDEWRRWFLGHLWEFTDESAAT